MRSMQLVLSDNCSHATRVHSCESILRMGGMRQSSVTFLASVGSSLSCFVDQSFSASLMEVPFLSAAAAWHNNTQTHTDRAESTAGDESANEHTVAAVARRAQRAQTGALTMTERRKEGSARERLQQERRRRMRMRGADGQWMQRLKGNSHTFEQHGGATVSSQLHSSSAPPPPPLPRSPPVRLLCLT